ncbi:hypothetical protein COCOBI_12-0340 [Coccomyxa sp. Obi]|nr:hypothetical protein COCOBI_12-0340 [Coccomyxa sp. Obi]
MLAGVSTAGASVAVSQITRLDCYRTLQRITFPLQIQKNGGLGRGTCFATYHFESHVLATARHTVEQQPAVPGREGELCLAGEAQISGVWEPFMVVKPLNDAVDRVSRNLDLVLLDLVNTDAPPGLQLAPTPPCAWGIAAGYYMNTDVVVPAFHTAEGTINWHGRFNMSIATHSDKAYSGGPIIDQDKHLVGMVQMGMGHVVKLVIGPRADVLSFFMLVMGFSALSSGT